MSNYGFIFSLLQDKNEIINDVDAYKVALVFEEFCNRKSHLNYNQEKLGNYNHDYYMGIYFFKVQGFHLGV